MRYEVEVLPGLEELAEREIRRRLPEANVPGRPAEGRILIRYDRDPRRLNALRTVVAVYRLEWFDVPRPRGLLGHQNLQRIVGVTRDVLGMYPSGRFRTLHLSAAGAESAVFARLKTALAADLGLTVVEGPGDLLVVVRRPLDRSAGWDVLVRLSPRPLSARSWRVCDLPGALNATVARVMVELADPRPTERFLNVACGSGTLLIERLGVGSARLALGVDLSPVALRCAAENLRASGHESVVALVRADASRLPFPDASFDTIAADLPYGMLVGSQRENARLYPAILAEAARVADDRGRFVAITASRRPFEAALAATHPRWELTGAFPVLISFRSGYLRPTVYVLRR